MVRVKDVVADGHNAGRARCLPKATQRDVLTSWTALRWCMVQDMEANGQESNASVAAVKGNAHPYSGPVAVGLATGMTGIADVEADGDCLIHVCQKLMIADANRRNVDPPAVGAMLRWGRNRELLCCGATLWGEGGGERSRAGWVCLWVLHAHVHVQGTHTCGEQRGQHHWLGLGLWRGGARTRRWGSRHAWVASHGG